MAVVRADLDAVFGFDNIELWADLNNNGNSGEIGARVAWAVALASSHVEARVSVLSYAWSEIETHALIEHAIVLKAGMLLYSPRAVSSEKDAPNPMRQHKKDYEELFSDLQQGRLALDAARSSRPFPAVIDDYYGDISTDQI